MVAISTTARDRYRRSGAILLVLGLVLGMVSILASPASAIDTAGKFELDGNPQDNVAVPGEDWSTLFPTTGVTQSLGRTFVQDLEAGDTSYYVGGGTKDDLPISGWIWDTQSHSPDKDDITNAYAASYLVGTQTVVTFGADRFDNSGDAQLGFWFLQGDVTTSSVKSGAGYEFDGDHEVGDVLVLVDFTNGGTSGTVSSFRWVGSGGNVPNNNSLQTLATGGICPGSTTGTVCAIANTTDGLASPWPYLDKSGNTTFLKNAFIEGAINLSALFPNNDICFSSFLAETRSSQEIGATLKDFALGGFHSCPQPELATTSSPTGTNVAPGTAVTDTLTVTGVAPNGFPSGTAAFYLCQPNQTSATVGCPEGAGSLVSTATVGAGPNAYTGTAQATSANTQTEGTYCWRATYTPDSNAHYTAPDGSHTNNTTECFTVVKPNVRIDKTAANTPITAGDVASFVITTTNDGPGTATSVTVSDTLPSGITWTDDKAQCDISGGVLTCNWGNLTSGTAKSVVVSGTTDAADCGTLNNTASVSATNEGTNRADNSDSASIVVNCGAINLRKTANPAGPVSAGSPIGFTIEVWNTGAGDVTSATVTDTLPTNDGVSWTVGGPDAGACNVAGGVLTCSFGTITSTDTTKTVTLSSPTTPATCGLVSNTAHVTTTNDGSATSTATVMVECPDVHVSKTGNGPIVAGDQAVFTIGAGNAGPGTAANVSLTDNLPAGLTWSETSDPSNACTITSGTAQTLSCAWQSVAAGTTNTVTITGTSSPGNCPSISNTATVSASNEPTADQSDNSASATIAVDCADVHVSKVGNGPLVAGGKATFTIGVGNAGPTTASAVTLTDNLPAGLTWAEDPNVAECTVTTGSAQVLSCTWSEVAPSTTKTVSVSGTTVRGNCPSISNTATVAARNETVADRSDNSASATIQVTCPSTPPPPPPPTTTTTEAPTTTTTQPPQVLPEVITTTTTTQPPATTTTLRVLGVQLARTGSDTAVWLRIAGFLLLLGGALLLCSDRRVWAMTHRR